MPSLKKILVSITIATVVSSLFLILLLFFRISKKFGSNKLSDSYTMYKICLFVFENNKYALFERC